jgi:hypothetical protein
MQCASVADVTLGRLWSLPKRPVILHPQVKEPDDAEIPLPSRMSALAGEDGSRKPADGNGGAHRQTNADRFLPTAVTPQKPLKSRPPLRVITPLALTTDVVPPPRGCATFRPEQSQQVQTRDVSYSITSSARVSTEEGIVMPSALAVFKLMTNCKVVGSCTGSSAGFAPFSIWTT